MGLLIRKIEADLLGADPEKAKLILIKVLKLKPEFILDKEHRRPLMVRLHQVSFQAQGQLYALAQDAIDHLNRILPLPGLPKDHFLAKNNILKKLQDRPSDIPNIYFCLLELRDVISNQGLGLVSTFLKHKDARIRSAALRLINLAGGRETLPQVLPFIADPDNRVKQGSLLILARFPAKEVLQTLKEMLESPDPMLREASVYSLAQLELTPLTRQFLIAATKDKLDTIRLRAIQAMSIHADEMILQRLHELQHDVSIEICEMATKAIKVQEKGLVRELVRLEE